MLLCARLAAHAPLLAVVVVLAGTSAGAALLSVVLRRQHGLGRSGPPPVLSAAHATALTAMTVAVAVAAVALVLAV